MNLLLLVLGTLLPLLAHSALNDNVLLPRATEWINGKDVAEKSLEEHVAALKKTDLSLGALETAGSCCAQFSGNAQRMSQEILINRIYGSTDIMKKTIKAYDCGVVSGEDMQMRANASCSYLWVFANKDQPKNVFAANCVPASVCAGDVVGMTKGKIATYGVVLQVLQENLGGLDFLGEGPKEACYDAMTKVNVGNFSSLREEKTHKFGSIVLYKSTEWNVTGMKKLTTLTSLGDCKADSPETGYLFIHKNKYWDAKKGALDLEGYLDAKAKKQGQKEVDKLMEEAKKRFPQREPKTTRKLANILI